MSALLLIAVGILIWRLATHHAKRDQRELLQRSAQVPGILGIPGILMCVHDDWAYWRVDGELMRAPLVCGRAELRHAHPIDLLTCDDVYPTDAIAIVDALDEAEVRYRPSRF